MVVLAIHFDIEPAIALKYCQVEHVRGFLVLWHRPHTGVVERFVKDPLPLGDQLRMRNFGIIGTGLYTKRAVALCVQRARVLRETRQVTDARIERGATVADYHQFRPRPCYRNVEE